RQLVRLFQGKQIGSFQYPGQQAILLDDGSSTGPSPYLKFFTNSLESFYGWVDGLSTRTTVHGLDRATFPVKWPSLRGSSTVHRMGLRLKNGQLNEP
ncbi:hypothetical protein HAX54_006874, partial [Datura stramonium]|nr:hypothetical protein [Datura stramonium]